MDVIVGDARGMVRLWNNTGSPNAPAFTEMTGNANCFGEIQLGERVAPALFDFDQDGDQDDTSTPSHHPPLLLRRPAEPAPEMPRI